MLSLALSDTIDEKGYRFLISSQIKIFYQEITIIIKETAGKHFTGTETVLNMAFELSNKKWMWTVWH